MTKLVIVTLLACMALSAGCGAMSAEIKSVESLPTDDGETAMFNKIAWISAMTYAKNEMAKNDFAIESERDIPYGMMAIFSSRSRHVIVRVVSVSPSGGAKVTVICESFGDPTQKSIAKAYIDAHPNAGILKAIGEGEDEREIAKANKAKEKEERQEERSAVQRQADAKAQASWDFESRSPAERIVGREWENTRQLYIRAGYREDEAELMADRHVGGRPKYLPPRD